MERTINSLINAAKRISSDSLLEASQSDATIFFPEKTLKNITELDFLTAAISSELRGLDLGLIAGTNLALLKILKYVGAGNLVVGRVLEGHINAQILINEFGDFKQKQRFANDAGDGKLFGVWNTQASDGTVLIQNRDGSYLLNGSKTFATGTDYVSRPLITAALEDGSWQMLVLPLDEIDKEVDESWWHPMGMKSSRSFKMTFKDVIISADNLIGNPGNYYEQPGFSGGAVRFAAVQMGAAEVLLSETIKYLKSLNRVDDPYQKMRLGQMTIAITSGNQWLEGAAKKMDAYMEDPSDENSEIFLTFTNMMRTAIEQICTEVMALCQKCVGARGLNKPYHFERIIRDLNTYLRQPAPDASLADIGRFSLQSEQEVHKLWEEDQHGN